MQLASLFTDGAVIQQNLPIAVWGWCSPYAKVSVSLGGITRICPSNSRGRFELRLPPFQAGGPFELTAVDMLTGEKQTVHDVLIGEVWLASGQSNMEFPLRTFVENDPGEQTAEFLAENGADSQIRVVRVPHAKFGMREDELPLRWEKSTAETCRDFTAVGAWFALRLRQHLHVPVGIISCAYGGTHIHAWMSRGALCQLPSIRNDLQIADDIFGLPEHWANVDADVKQYHLSSSDVELFTECTHMDTGNQGVGKGWANVDFDDSCWKIMSVPGDWLRQGINGNGATWIRKHVIIPECWKNRPLILHLGGIDKHDIAYFNGVQIGATGSGFETQFWNQPREYTIPAHLVQSGMAVVAIRAFSFIFDGGFIGKSEDYWLAPADIKPNETRIPLWGNWLAQAEYTIQFTNGFHDRRKTSDPHFTRHNSQDNLHALFDGMIAPLIPYAIRGVIWYQGEEDCTAEICNDYANRLSAMITDWRYVWNEGDFPFYMVQLANYDTPFANEWLTVQDAQRRVANALDSVGVIPASDIGEEQDIHPHDKRSFGARLARLALNDTYGLPDATPNGPVVSSAVMLANHRVRVNFRFADGLHSGDGNNENAAGFEVAGANGVFHSVHAEIIGNAVVLNTDGIQSPEKIRYNWTSCPKSHISNSANLPALTFCLELDSVQ